MTTQSSFLRTGNIWFTLALILAGAAAIYGFMQYRIVQASEQAILDNASSVMELSEEVGASRKAFQAFADERAKVQAEFSKKIAAIFPIDEHYTDLTRQLDDYFAAHDLPGNEIFQSSLRFGKGAPVAGMPGVSALPTTMNLDATRDNFFKFLDFVGSSGSLENGMRLMQINSIQLNFPDGGENVKDAKQKINFTVDMSAFYQSAAR